LFPTFSNSLLSFCFLQPVPATKATMMQPNAPAEGNPIVLLPTTDKTPAKNISVNFNPLAYFCKKETIFRFKPK
jgi:hypothetical protein